MIIWNRDKLDNDKLERNFAEFKNRLKLKKDKWE